MTFPSWKGPSQSTPPPGEHRIQEAAEGLPLGNLQAPFAQQQVGVEGPAF